MPGLQITRICHSVPLYLWAWFLFLIFSLPAQAQDRCATPYYDSLLREKYPELEKKGHFENWMQQQLQVRLLEEVTDTVYRIPVVVHVIHNGEPVGVGSNISNDQIFSQIEVLNEDFRRLNADTVNTPGDFQGVAIDPRIVFQLALRNPDGEATTGIVRVQGSKTEWSISDNTLLKSQSYWPAEDYLNIWVAPMDPQYVGYAQFPVSTLPGLESSPDNRLTDGVVIAHWGFGSVDKYPDADLDPRFSLGRTATHEIGHFLGLRHLSGDSGCSLDDYCADTPNMGSDHNSIGLPCTYPGPNTCDEGGDDLPDMIQNFLTLVHDPCMNLFTADQCARMHVVIQNSIRRASLLTSPALEPPVDYEVDAGITRAIGIEPYSCQGELIPAIEIKNLGNIPLGSVTVEMRLNGTLVDTGGITSDLEPDDSVIIDFIPVVLDYGVSNQSFEFSITEANGGPDENDANNDFLALTQVGAGVNDGVFLDFSQGIDNWEIRNPDQRTGWKTRTIIQNGFIDTVLSIDYYNYDGFGGESDYFVSPFIELTNADTLLLTFKYAYARYPTRSDELRVAVTHDCGNTFEDFIFIKSGADLQSVSQPFTDEFIPNEFTQWNTATIDLSRYLGNTDLQLAFIGINDNGNNLYLDDIRIHTRKSLEITTYDKYLVRPNPISCGYVAPRLLIENTGTETITSFLASWSIEPAGMATTNPVSVQLDPGQQIQFGFGGGELAPGDYRIQISLSLPNGQPVSSGNLTAERLFRVDITNDRTPVRENFEPAAGNADWFFYFPDENFQSWEAEPVPKDKPENTAASLALFESAIPGARSWIVSPIIDFSGTGEASLVFDLSYAARGSEQDVLNIYSIRDCTGSSMELIYSEQLVALAVTEFNQSWRPSTDLDWERINLDLGEFAGESGVRFILEVISDNGNNVYLDDIDIYESADPDPIRIEKEGFSIYPNPSADGNFNLTFNKQEKETVRITITDRLGRIISDQLFSDALNQTLNLSLDGKPAGLYLVRIAGPSGSDALRIFKGRP